MAMFNLGKAKKDVGIRRNIEKDRMLQAGEDIGLKNKKDSITKKKIVVTGAAGFLGSKFVSSYKDVYDITALSHSDMDITDDEETLSVLSECRPDIVIHAAAISDTLISESNPGLSQLVNVEGPANVAKACRENGAKLIYMSSDQIYNGCTEPGPYNEETKVNPMSVYGSHKLAAEYRVAEITPDACILRLTWLYNIPERNLKTNSNIIWNTVKSIMKNEPISCYDFSFRGFTYIYDLVEKIPDMFEIPGGVYNAGSENDLNLYETTALIFKLLGLEHRIGELIKRDEITYRSQPRDLRINIDKLRSFGISFDPFEDSVKRCLKEYGFYV